MPRALAWRRRLPPSMSRCRRSSSSVAPTSTFSFAPAAAPLLALRVGFCCCPSSTRPRLREKCLLPWSQMNPPCGFVRRKGGAEREARARDRVTRRARHQGEASAYARYIRHTCTACTGRCTGRCCRRLPFTHKNVPVSISKAPCCFALCTSRTSNRTLKPRWRRCLPAALIALLHLLLLLDYYSSTCGDAVVTLSRRCRRKGRAARGAACPPSLPPAAARPALPRRCPRWRCGPA